MNAKAVGGIWAKRRSKAEAIKAYTDAYDANELKRV